MKKQLKNSQSADERFQLSTFKENIWSRILSIERLFYAYEDASNHSMGFDRLCSLPGIYVAHAIINVQMHSDQDTNAE